MVGRLARLVIRLLHWYWRVFNLRTRGARFFVIKEGKVLLVRNRFGKKLIFPGGAVKKTETFLEGAARELREELKVGVMGEIFLLGKYTSSYEGKKDIINIFVTHVSKDWEPKGKSIEISSWGWYDLNKLPGEVSGGTRRRIYEFLEGRTGIQGDW